MLKICIGSSLLAFLFLLVPLFSDAFASDTLPSSCDPPSWMPKSVPGICDWKQAPRLPSPRAYSAAVAFKNKIYVAGGFEWNAAESKLTYYDEVVAAQAGTGGDLGNWAIAGKFEHGRTGVGMAALNSCLFIVGGSWSDTSGVLYGDDVQVAKLDQSQLAFATSPNHLITPRSNLALLGYQNGATGVLYAIGGVTQAGNDTVHLDTIEYASVDGACNVGPWKKINFDLKGGRGTSQAIIHDGRIYVVGGWGDLDLVDIYNDVQYASIRPDGSITPWQTAANKLPSGIYGHTVSTFETSDKQSTLLLMAGGQPSTGIYTNAVSYAYLGDQLLPKGTVGPWAGFYKMLPDARAGHTVAAIGTWIYLIGGSQAGGRYLDDVIFTSVKPGRPE